MAENSARPWEKTGGRRRLMLLVLVLVPTIYAGAYMVVLDADSIMAGETIAAMVSTMEARPDIGILQTIPRAVNRETLIARLQQFANHVYGPILAAGLHFWQLGDAQYWGHNAIIRIEPFMKHCGLPQLSGKPPLGGAILSHDFVESAIMRRAGWGIWLAYDLPGSYEEMPPTLIDELQRDRRWCQGNLQHLRLLFAAGLFPVHRAVYLIHRPFTLWLAPVLLSLVLSPATSVWTSRKSVGLRLKKAGLLLIPAEFAPGDELKALKTILSRGRLPSTISIFDSLQGFIRAVVDPVTHNLHLSLLRGQRRLNNRVSKRRREFVKKALDLGPQALSTAEKIQLLKDPDKLTQLHQTVWKIADPRKAALWGLVA